MNEVLVRAIREKYQIRFLYHDKVRIAEPQCYGVGTKGHELLRVYQVKGGDQMEPLFEVAKMEGLALTDKRFTKPGPNYKRGDSAMKVIYAQL
jgi:hypothetical protein